MHVDTDSSSGLALLQLEGPGSSAQIALQGGHLWRCVTAGRERLFTSELSPWAPGQALRGGVPLCWPWLGLRGDAPQLGLHGPLRCHPFTLAAWRTTSLALEVRLDSFLEAGLPGVTSSCAVELVVRLAAHSCTLAWTVHNVGNQPQVSAGAMHTYLRCRATQARVSGLDGCPWHGPDGSPEQGLVDGVVSECCARTRTIHHHRGTIIELADGEQRVRIQRLGSASTVLWNPGPDHGIADLGATDWQSFLCIESANSDHDRRLLQPGQRHRMITRYSWLAPSTGG